jgi:hypothetical protein
MNYTDNNLASVLTELHARICRLEITALALTKALAAGGRLPAGFAATFKEDVQKQATAVSHPQFQSQLNDIGSQWTSLFEALAKESESR